MRKLIISDEVLTNDGEKGTVVEFDTQGPRTVCVRIKGGGQVWYRF